MAIQVHLLLLGLTCVLAVHVQGRATDELIIGGKPSAKGRWPWMLSLQRLRASGNYTHTCGASLLTPNWILSAAHCLKSMPKPEDYRVLVGAFTQDDYEDMIYLKRIIVHEKYGGPRIPGVPYDVGVAELARPVDLEKTGASLVQLPRHGDVFVNNPNCWATGWGRYNPETRDASYYLRELRTRVHSLTECASIWDSLRPGWGSRIIDQHVCVAGPNDGVCHGDSGSPLNCDVTGNNDWVVAGVASWASGSKCIGATGVYAGIEPFIDWVRDKVPGLPGNKPRGV